MLLTTKLRKWMTANTSKIAYGALSIATFVALFLHANNRPFWLDELCQIAFSGTTDTLWETIRYDPHTPPLYDAALYFWYRIAPYGERWLLLLSEAAVAITVFVTGLTGERLRNRRTGLLAASLLALNASVLLICGWELRPQSFMLLFSTLSLYEWVARVKKPGFSIMRMVRFCAWMTLSGYSHYFGVLFGGMLFVMDCFLVWRKKTDFRHLFSYGLAALLYIPWLMAVMVLERSIVGSWQPVPSLQSVESLIRFLSGQNMLVFCMLIFAVVFLVAKVLLKSRSFIEIAPIFITCTMISAVYLYGNCIAWRSTFWVNRYFSALFPCAMIACSLALDAILEIGLRHRRKSAAFICAGLLLFVGWNTVQVVGRANPAPHRAATEWLYAEGDVIYSDDTVVLASVNPWFLLGWREYYITKQGTRDPFHLMSAWTVTDAEDLLQYNTVYHLSIDSTQSGWGLPEGLREMLEDHYVLLDENEEMYIRVYGKSD
ncbi:MAG: glycosyltransferase family 39 protein [Clostridia bacterium]|nr:glycosyltransferase family 39 protein [Clostridia bacterium]